MRIFLDNNLWNYLADNEIDLMYYFPANRYELCITTHGKYEIEQLVNENKQYIKEFALDALISTVREDSIFGFYSDLFPKEHQRSSGFGAGRFIDESESLLRTKLVSKYGTLEKRKETQILFKQEADIELAWRSKNSPVITFDANKSGPLLYALNQGWKVVSLDVDRSRKIPSGEFMQEIVSAVEAKAT
ncbi:MAG: hypothetical protein PSN04_11045 [Methyloprofundus sp.]|nr:hypothetical protein [Methyloprofundus sp.]